MIPPATVFLVVDDLELMRSVTVRQLRAHGLEKILTARNGVEALRLLRAQRVDVVLSDWNMPVMNGLELLSAVRADDKLRRLPFIMITAEAERSRIQQVIAAGVSGLLVKPYTSAGLHAQIEKVLAAKPRQAQTGAGAAAAAAQRAALVAAGPRALASAGTKPPSTLLVVDDTPISVKLLTQLFKDDYRVLSAGDGNSALELCRSDHPPDLVLMDVLMPEMDGFEVVKRMREHPGCSLIPVIFVSAADGDEARLKGMELGAVDFVSKKIDPTVLKLRVRNFVNYVNLRKELQADFDAMLDNARLQEDVQNITRHDLKSGLAGVVGMVQSLAEDPSLSPEHATQLRLIEATALQVMNMVNLSSELYKIETGHFTLQPKPVEIGEVLRRVVEISRSTFTDKKLTLEVDTDTIIGQETPRAVGDAMLCYSLFQNLVKNACEAAPAGSRIKIRLADEDPLRITIHNRGAVPTEVRHRFFDKFSTHGKPGGTGLGTYSAKLLCTAQNGHIAVAVSDADDSTMLTVTLPRQPTAKDFRQKRE